MDGVSSSDSETIDDDFKNLLQRVDEVLTEAKDSRKSAALVKKKIKIEEEIVRKGSEVKPSIRAPTSRKEVEETWPRLEQPRNSSHMRGFDSNRQKFSDALLPDFRHQTEQRGRFNVSSLPDDRWSDQWNNKNPYSNGAFARRSHDGVFASRPMHMMRASSKSDSLTGTTLDKHRITEMLQSAKETPMEDDSLGEGTRFSRLQVEDMLKDSDTKSQLGMTNSFSNIEASLPVNTKPMRSQSHDSSD